MSLNENKRVAIIGGGISGLTTSYYLLKDSSITVDLYEKDDALGGHSKTICVENENIDIGFQVFNYKTYPNMLRLFHELGVETVESNMSFGVFDKSFEWGGKGIYSLLVSMFNYKFLILIWNLFWFFRDANSFLTHGKTNSKHKEMTIREFCDMYNYKGIFIKYYLIPFCSAVWSMGEKKCEDMNAYCIFTFMKNHSLLQFQNEQWYTLKNRSKEYVDKILKTNTKTQRFHVIHEEVLRVENTGLKGKKSILTKNANTNNHIYDVVIFAVNCHQVYPLLQDSSLETQEIKDAYVNFSSTENKLTIHKDPKVMAKNANLWCSWNTQINESGEKPVTSYWFQSLQGIQNKNNVFLTLNATSELKNTLAEYTLYHPEFTCQTEKYKEKIQKFQGQNNLYFTGAYLHNGFHEDGVVSAIDVVNRILPNEQKVVKLSICKETNFIDTLFFRIFMYVIQKMITQSHLQVFYKGNVYTVGNKEIKPTHLYIHSPKFFHLVLLKQDIGLSESYMNKYIETDSLFELLNMLVKNNATDNAIYSILPFTFLGRLYDVFQHEMNFNSIENSRKNIHKHYDLSNELYKRFLDKSMTYSSAFFKDLSPTQENLYLAQQNKYSRITQKLGIDFSKNPHILEIGCGWGGYAQSLVRESRNKYFSYTGITISEEQYAYCIELFQNDSRISIVLIDYRLIRGTFDYVVSIEMIEAVGIQYMDTYFKTIYNRLNKNGKAMIQAITIPDHRYETYKKDVDFIQKYIFPGGICPCIKDIVKNSSQNSLILVDMNHFGFDYKHTLLLWLEKFTQHFHEIREFGFDEYFYLTWKYYFIYCAVGFHNKIINVNQMMFQKY